MPRQVASAASPKNGGPALPADWQARFLAAYKQLGGVHLAAEAASIHPETVRRYRHADPAFDAACLDAREFYADTLERDLIASAERSDNPVGYIVRLKALRPAEYIEKHAVMSLNVHADLPSADAAQLLRDMLGTLTESSRHLLSTGPPPLPSAEATAP
jgi:hypothetical protein